MREAAQLQKHETAQTKQASANIQMTVSDAIEAKKSPQLERTVPISLNSKKIQKLKSIDYRK